MQTDKARVTLSELNSTSSTVTEKLNMGQNELPERDALSEEREATLLAVDNKQDESSNADSTTTGSHGHDGNHERKHDYSPQMFLTRRG